MEIPELLLLVMETSLVSLCMKIMSVLITVILYGRMIEIYAYCSVSPIPFATMTNREWGQIGNNYLKGLFALGFPHYDMRRHLRGFSRRNGGSGQSAQRDFFPCSLYRYPLFLPVQIRRTGKIHFQCTLTQHTRESPAERRFFLGVCTCTQRLIQSQNKSRFQSDKAANPLFFSGTSYGTAAFLFAQRQRRDEPCGNGNDCRHASLLLGCHV